MRDTSVAARYARALFLVTEKRQETQRALEDLKGMLPVLAADSPASRFLASPGIRPVDKREAIRRALDGRTVKIVAVFLDLLLRKKRLPQFDVVVREFEALVERSQGVQRAHVVSATSLVTAEVERLHRELERYTGSKILLTQEVDPALLGGALVRIEDRVIDRSVRTLLDTMSRQLYEVSV